jgi:dUTP pyrophosphatase
MNVIKFSRVNKNDEKKLVFTSPATAGSAGFDLTCHSIKDDRYMDWDVSSRKIALHGSVTFGTGWSVAIPHGFVGLIVPRSSAHKSNVKLANDTGVIDSDYRGEILLKVESKGEVGLVEMGKPYFQMVVVPCLTACEEVDSLDETVRGKGGFGSTNE